MKMPFESGFRIVSPYGYRTDPITGTEDCWHGGVDLVGFDRTVRAAVGGTVLQSRIVTDHENRTWEWGNYVSVWGDDNHVIYYCHLEERYVQPGRRVEAGQRIGLEGSTGRSTGPHLHFEVRNTQEAQIDPCAYLGIPNKVGYVWTPPDPIGDETSDWSREAVEWCVDNSIIRGDGEGLKLSEPVTREQMCVFLFRLYGLIKTE